MHHQVVVPVIFHGIFGCKLVLDAHDGQFVLSSVLYQPFRMLPKIKARIQPPRAPEREVTTRKRLDESGRRNRLKRRVKLATLTNTAELDGGGADLDDTLGAIADQRRADGIEDHSRERQGFVERIIL